MYWKGWPADFAKRLECVKLASAFPESLKSGSKLHALQTLRELVRKAVFQNALGISVFSLSHPRYVPKRINTQ